jgi:hypothetical protein
MAGALQARVCVGLFCLSCLAVQPARADAAIEWRLENPFRLFKNPADTAMHAKVFASLSAAEKKESPILSAERILALQTKGRGWAEQIFNNTCFDQDRSQYSACKDYIVPKSHRAVFWLKAKPSAEGLLNALAPDASLSDSVCAWSVQTPGSPSPRAVRRAPCHKPVTLDVPYPRGFRVSVTGQFGVAAPLDVKVRDALILAMGDSFGAGEGNPDYAEKFNDARTVDYGKVELAENDEHLQLNGYPAREGNWKDINSGDFDHTRAQWWDRECHRSLYSHQLRAALQLALEDPKRAITFVSYSCSGSEVAQGILLRKPVRECSPGQSNMVPGQLSTASEDLCAEVDRDLLMPQSIINRMPELGKLPEEEMKVSRCSKKARGNTSHPRLKRKVDLVLLSIGGNDVGFVSVLSDAMLSEHSVYRILGKPVGAVYGVDKARKQLKILQQRLEALRFDLSFSLDMPLEGASQKRVILTGYPHMGFREDGVTPCSGRDGMEVFPPFKLNPERVRRAEDFADELNLALTATSRFGWRVVTGFDADFRSHGLCATKDGGASPVESLAIPLRKGNQWRPFPPSSYQPYASRQRWFRTPNDAFLASNMHARQVANFGVQCSMAFSSVLALAKQHWRPFQLFLASTYGGSFHPTAEGQARLADEVVKEARAIIDARE